jgi:hypothetical protein
MCDHLELRDQSVRRQGPRDFRGVQSAEAGGRFAVSDVVVRGDDVPSELRRSMELWVSCVAGALEKSTYRSM